ncbi:MAG: pilin [Candidatus Uhrbacteria bacterium]|nr:pilin [Candidatus Uhrbacteria bacterium]
MTFFRKYLFLLTWMIGALLPMHFAFAGSCVCTTSSNDCQPAFLSITDQSKAACDKTCKTILNGKFGSSTFEEETAGEVIVQNCSDTHKSFLAAQAAALNSTTTPPKTPPKDLITPTLNVNIPGLKFSPGIISAENVKTNFLADYLNALYAFLIGAAVVIAIVMIMVGGLQYTIGASNPAQVGKGKDRIKNAITGLTLLLCVFIILKTTNPQLVLMKMIELQNVQAVDFDFGPDTLSADEAQQADAGPSVSSGPYQFKYFQSCPVPLTNPIEFKDAKQKAPGDIRKNIPRRAEFHEKVRGLITGTVGERIVKSIEATTQCKIQYENCGVGTTNIYALAANSGAFGDGCLANTDPKTPCNILGYGHGNIHKKIVHDISSGTTSYGIKVSQLLKGFFCPSAAKCSTTKWPEPCIQDQSQAASKLATILSNINAKDKWSPNWINELQPGDYYMVVNWNPSCQSTHSAMFLGWQDQGSKIATVEMADAAHFLRIGTKHFSADDIVIQISRPVE